jgi:DNA-binding transcriptional LysR family regulator
MRMQQLRYFLAVLDHGGFSRAAAHLGRTQQAVSKALGLLEDELGVRVLDRESGVPQATAFGRELERFARGVVRDEAALRERLSASRGDVAATVTLRVGPTAASLVADAAARLARSQPQLVLRVRDGVQSGFAAALRDGALVAIDAPQFAWQRPLELACRAAPAASPALLAVVQALHEARDARRHACKD